MARLAGEDEEKDKDKVDDDDDEEEEEEEEQDEGGALRPSLFRPRGISIARVVRKEATRNAQKAARAEREAEEPATAVEAALQNVDCASWRERYLCPAHGQGARAEVLLQPAHARGNVERAARRGAALGAVRRPERDGFLQGVLRQRRDGRDVVVAARHGGVGRYRNGVASSEKCGGAGAG